MEVMSKRQEEVLQRLIRLAGDPELVEDTIRKLNAEKDDTPTLDDVIEAIILKLYRTAQAHLHNEYGREPTSDEVVRHIVQERAREPREPVTA